LTIAKVPCRSSGFSGRRRISVSTPWIGTWQLGTATVCASSGEHLSGFTLRTSLIDPHREGVEPSDTAVYTYGRMLDMVKACAAVRSCENAMVVHFEDSLGSRRFVDRVCAKAIALPFIFQ
jgi:hypothetical protein